ncbi:19540_t:CDS:2 [Gigaspora margarita]|uniref:19540_t:CDS:1 n=1 Tax=Gigaspora margarita TaxID=4874 RepID=A0ABN7VRR8_GIGMA|nr:19540_t:CDS:2 [Gigaspora margarita]
MAKIRIKQGLLKANIIDRDWHFEADTRSFNIYIRPIFEQWHFQETGPQIREFIDTSLFIKSSKSISDLAEKKARWFSFIENVLLQNPKNREIKEIYQTSDKENDELETRKIVKKWYVKIEKSNSSLISEQNSEYSWLEQSKVVTVISKLLLKNNQKYILKYKDILPIKASRYNTSKPSKEESLLYSLQSVESLDNQLIIDQNFDINLANNLVNSLDCNISSSKNKSILTLEPEANNSKLDWYTYWKRIKKLKGVRCNTLQKSKKLTTQLKCLSGNLLVLKTLATRRPEIYSFDSCIVCNTSTSETHNHLAKCSYYKTMWQNIESTAIDLVWSKFMKEEKYCCPKHLLHKILIGLSKVDIQEKRRLWIKGLTSVGVFDVIKDLLNSSKMTARTIELTIHIMWNGFYDFIWKDRCVKVIDWEEKQNIRKKDKREVRDKNLKLKKIYHLTLKAKRKSR